MLKENFFQGIGHCTPLCNGSPIPLLVLCNPIHKTMLTSSKHTHTHTTILLLFWNMSGTTRVSRYQKVRPGRLKPIWIYWSKRQWAAVASAGLHASLHLIPDNHANIPPLSFLQADALPDAQSTASKHW